MDPVLEVDSISANGLLKCSILIIKLGILKHPDDPKKLAVYAGRMKITNRNRNPNRL